MLILLKSLFSARSKSVRLLSMNRHPQVPRSKPVLKPPAKLNPKSTARVIHLMIMCSPNMYYSVFNTCNSSSAAFAVMSRAVPGLGQTSSFFLSEVRMAIVD